MAQTKAKVPVLSDDEVRRIVLQYLYDRNKRATSRRGKSTGASATISVMRADLKASQGLIVQQIHCNLTYLISQGWVEDQPMAKSFQTGGGRIVPSSTSYYIITAAGIDKISGPSEFTRDRFQGIKIEATGQNIITLGDGNQINSQFESLGEALSELKHAAKVSDTLTESQKMELVVDIDTLQTQLGRAAPNRSVINQLWEAIHRVASIAGLVGAAEKAGALIADLLA